MNSLQIISAEAQPSFADNDRVYALVDLTGLIARLIELETALRCARGSEAEALFRREIDGGHAAPGPHREKR